MGSMKIYEKMNELLKVENNLETYRNEIILNNKEFQNFMKISAATSLSWRAKNIIAYYKINNKIYYTMKDIKIMMRDNFKPLKKK